ncbi:hypothetical protein GH714_001326 [Hevea brasiliensis]|uniref:Uncharacterized protein n=1 Tax=Hevea brasiliensis TaxID=3981 RepID=A0A6A6LAQ8_HEVBR|nr:hypothetical protein GH714_001326 [Hevea brasiliensis]
MAIWWRWRLAFEVKVRHCFREANFVANRLANLAVHSEMGLHILQWPPAQGRIYLGGNGALALAAPLKILCRDGRGKWKRRKRDPQITRKQHPKHEHEDPDDEGEDDAVEDYNNNNHLDDDSEAPNLPQSAALPDPDHLKTEVTADGEVRICDFPSVTKLAVNRPHESVFAIVALEWANLIGANNGSCRGQVPNFENVSYGQLQAVSTVPAEGFGSDQERNDGGNSAYVVTPPPNMEGKGVVKRFGTRVHVVPMHSDWFSPATVNRLERQVVPHFFCGKSPDHTPEKYMECRNYVVAKYMENPGKRITVSDFQGLVVGTENEDLARIVRFLDHWGIINYCAGPPSRESWNGGSYLREDPNGEVHVPSAALKSIDSLIKFDKPKCRLKAADVYSSLSCRDDDFSDLDNRIRERISENCCTYCSQHLPGIYFQSQKEIDVLLCSDCFHEGRFVTNHSSLDFIKMDPTKDYSDLDGEVGVIKKHYCCLRQWRLPFWLLLLDQELQQHVPMRPWQHCPEDNRVNSEKLHGREGNFQGEVANQFNKRVEDNVHGSRVPNEAEGVLLSAEKVKAAAKAGLAAAATKAKLFADHEEREIQRLSANIINHQLKRLELKLKQFAEVETFLMRECEQVEKTRQRFAAERARILSTQIGPAGATSQMNLGGVSPSMVSNNVGSSRQQVMPTSSSQPSISGYGNNQQVHPHIPFVQRGQPQPMFH